MPAIAASRDALDFLYRDFLHLDLGELPYGCLDAARPGTSGPAGALRPTTEDCYVQWARRFILFHARHTRDMGTAEVEQFLTDLAVNGQVSASTQNQALNAALFISAGAGERNSPASTPCAPGDPSSCPASSLPRK